MSIWRKVEAKNHGGLDDWFKKEQGQKCIKI